MACGYAAGYETLPRPSLPAAQTTTTPLSWAYLTAFDSTDEAIGPPSDMLMTLAPWSAAQRMPLAMPDTEPEPRAESTLIGMILAWKATPATPMPLCVDCAMVPATCVPWPWSS